MDEQVKVGIFVDPLGTSLQNPELEYREIEKEVRDALRGTSFIPKFKREIQPDALSSERLDIYIVDYGGISMQGCSGLIDFYNRELIKSIEDKQGTLFIIWSSMMINYILEDRRNSGLTAEAPNLIFRGSIYDFASGRMIGDQDVGENIKRWLGISAKATRAN